MHKDTHKTPFQRFFSKYWQGHAQWLWAEDIRHRPLWQRGLWVVARLLHSLWYDLASGQLSLRATSLVYTTVIALVPLLALGFSVLKGLGVHNQLEPMLLGVMEPLGEKRFEIVTQLIGFVDNVKVGVLGTVGFVILLYSVIAMLQKIESAFNFTWRVKHGRSLVGRVSHYLSATLLAPLFVFLSLALTSAISDNRFSAAVRGLPWVGEWMSQFGQLLLSFMVLTTGFTLLYRLVPNTAVRWTSALVAGVVAALAWKVMGWGVATFVTNANSNTVIYSAFASVILFLLWIYFSWLVVLLGASISFHLQNPHTPAHRSGWKSLSSRDRINIGCAVMLSIARRYRCGEGGCSRAELTEQLSTSGMVVNDVLQCLMQAGWVLQSETQPKRYLPTRPAELMWLDELLELLQQYPKKHAAHTSGEVFQSPLDGFIQPLQAQRVTLAQVLEEHSPAAV